MVPVVPVGPKVRSPPTFKLFMPPFNPRAERSELAELGAKLNMRHLRCRVGTIYVTFLLLAPPEGDLGPKSYYFEV